MNILGIESSCDETAAAVVRNGKDVLSSVVATQIPVHRPYSGVVPELASRSHVLSINAVIQKTMEKNKSKKIDAIAVTVGPGLPGSLLVGKMTAESLGWVTGLPVIGVNHLEGHLLSPLIENPVLEPPFLGLIVSGGHTELVVARQWNHYQRLGRTRDDAAGEAFDKVAKMLGLGYPGGPVIDRLAKMGQSEHCSFPKPWLPGTWDFSFSGLKTAVLYKLRERKKWPIRLKRDICAGFQSSVVEVLVGKTMAAAQALQMQAIVVGGGVAANSFLRSQLLEEGRRRGIKVLIASPHMCTDNAAMIASAAYFKIKFQKGKYKNALKIQPQLQFPPLKENTPVFRPQPQI